MYPSCPAVKRFFQGQLLCAVLVKAIYFRHYYISCTLDTLFVKTISFNVKRKEANHLRLCRPGKNRDPLHCMHSLHFHLPSAVMRLLQKQPLCIMEEVATYIIGIQKYEGRGSIEFKAGIFSSILTILVTALKISMGKCLWLQIRKAILPIPPHFYKSLYRNSLVY